MNHNLSPLSESSRAPFHPLSDSNLIQGLNSRGQMIIRIMQRHQIAVSCCSSRSNIIWYQSSPNDPCSGSEMYPKLKIIDFKLFCWVKNRVNGLYRGFPENPETSARMILFWFSCSHPPKINSLFYHCVPSVSTLFYIKEDETPFFPIVIWSQHPVPFHQLHEDRISHPHVIRS